MLIKGRLALIASKVPKCNCVCDVGTDHAYIPIYLIKNDICCRAIASDLTAGPIETAKRNIDLFGLNSNIETRIGYGLSTLRKNEADVIVIAGMGGMLIAEILEKDIDKARTASTLVIQPMSAVEITRKWLYDNGFDIFDEELVKEGRKIYNVIVAKWTGRKRKIDEVYYYIGEMLEKKRDPLLKEYITRRLNTLRNILEEIERKSEYGGEKYIEYKNLYNDLNGILAKLKEDE